MLNIIVTGQRYPFIPNLLSYCLHKLIITQPFSVDKYPVEKIWYSLNSFISWATWLTGERTKTEE